MRDLKRKSVAPFARYWNLNILIRLAGQKNLFPFYHLATNTQAGHVKHLYHTKTITEFRNDLDYLLRYFEPVSMRDYFKKLEAFQQKRCMVLSFDDGLAECYDEIAPILLKKGIPATFFLNNEFLDNKEMFYRYKASILIERIAGNACFEQRAAEFLMIPEEQVIPAIRMITHKQEALLDGMAPLAEVDFREYMKKSPVYMTSGQIRKLLEAGFEIGAHSRKHHKLDAFAPEEMEDEIRNSVEDLKQKFDVRDLSFSFPFNSVGVPERIIHSLLEDGTVPFIFGTAGIKKTGHPRFIQRLPMEMLDMAAKQLVRTEYLYYLLKSPLGKNQYRY